MAGKIVNFTINSEKISRLNRYILQDDFQSKLMEIGKLNLSITQKPSQAEVNVSDIVTGGHGSIEIIGALSRASLDPRNGSLFTKRAIIGGYDESKLEFVTLEGVANITSHVLVEVVNREFIPISYITLYFYTRSEEIVNKSKYVRYSKDPASDSNRDYAEDRNTLLQSHVLDNSILFVDGPLIGGNLTSYSLKLIKELHKSNVIPIFFVKNSDSNLLIDSIPSIKDKYNSDLHWAYQFLRQGERTNFFKYTDLVNPKNTKIFCYIKPFNSVSPQRVELHPQTFSLYGEYIDDIFDTIYYLMLVQGDKSNPQIRPIAIAEKYAREIIKTVNTRSLLRNTSLVPTINQERFGG
jgi:hypothetical protein